MEESKYKELARSRIEEMQLLNTEKPMVKENLQEHKEKILVKLVGNPVHVFGLLQRLVKHLPLLSTEILSKIWSIQDVKTSESIQSLKLEDVTEAAENLARIGFIYRCT